MTTLAVFVTALGAMPVTGVKRYYSEPPASLSDADLPAQWVQLPQSAEAPLTFQANGGWPRLTAQLVIAYQPVAQNTQAANWSGTLAILDAMATALHAATGIGRGGLSWTVRPGIATVAGVEYWAAIADVIGNG